MSTPNLPEAQAEQIAESDALHTRVREFAAGGEAPESFERLAVAIAAFQARHVPGYRNLAEAHGSRLDDWERLPGVPTEAFRMTRVAVHPPELDAARFETSGTTQARKGYHPLRTLETYRQLALSSGRAALIGDWLGRPLVIALAPRPEWPARSSLSCMMRWFMDDFDARAIARDAREASYDWRDPGRWLAGPAGVDVDALRRTVAIARDRQDPLLILGTAFALVALVDSLEGLGLPCPRQTVVMQTGGFKGRSRILSPGELRSQLSHALHISPERVVGEYGMTELGSQLYQTTLPGASYYGRAERECYLPPRWLRVVPVDPKTLEPTREGEVGLAKMVDLANVDSAVCVLTEDLVRRRGDAFELLGRAPMAEPRGCSLATEAMLAAPL